jgi:hypothetical protein
MTDPEILIQIPHSTSDIRHSEDPERDVATREERPTVEPPPQPTPPQDRIAASTRFFSALQVAQALSAMGRTCTKKTVQRHASKGQWPSRANGNRTEYLPPADIAQACNELFPPFDSEFRTPNSALRISFADITDSVQRSKILVRESAVLLYHKLVKQGFGKEYSLHSAIMHAYREAAKVGLSVGSASPEGPSFSCSSNTLRSWIKLYAAHGLNGLVEQKQGACGRKSAISLLDPEDVIEIRNKGRALACDFGQGGTPNAARAARELSADPSLPHALRNHLHGAHASKSHVTPSVRELITPDAVTTGLVQIGDKHRRLSLSPFTPGDWSQVKAMDVVTADDMTANVYVWVEWPNEKGWLLIRPQILAALDCGTLMWINIRAIIRPKGQYNKDDVWGLVGDLLDHQGKPGAFLFEGGTWQSNVVKGHKTGLDDDSRFGGLQSLGIKLFRSFQPRSKPIEMAFNQLQYAADNCKGYCGREEKNDCPEAVKRAQYLCESGKAHPREFFLHLSQYTTHIETQMQLLNTERNDGQILRGKGETPADAWLATLDPSIDRKIPDNAKWMYRAAYNIETVRANGVCVTVKSGKYAVRYWYDNREALQPIIGRRVAVFWNDYDPDADAVILLLDKKNGLDGFHCVAPRIANIGRFNASKEQLRAEAQRKALSAQLARTESRALAPHLQRGNVSDRGTSRPAAAARGGIPSHGGEGQGEGGLSSRVSAEITGAADRHARKTKTRHNIAREIDNVEVTEDMIRAGTRRTEEDFEL